ncbi:unnamed protein product [Arctogadus glacialis]
MGQILLWPKAQLPSPYRDTSRAQLPSGVYVESNMAAAAADPAVASARHSANERRLSLTQRWAVNQS